MYAYTPKFSAALVNSHTVLSQADLYVGPTLVAAGLPVIGGTVTEDSTALVRSRVSLELAATSEVLAMLPTAPPVGGSLWPLGNELRVYSGIDYEDGTTPELIPQGVFRINKPKINDGGADISIQVEGFDRARSVSRAKFTVPYVIAEGTDYPTAIKNLIKSRLANLSDADFQFMTTSYTTPQLVFAMGDDPWEKATQMAQSIGAELFWSNTGVCILRPEPDPFYTTPVWIYQEGVNATFLSVGRELDDDQAFNGVIVTSSNTDMPTPLRGEAWDTTVTSPTFYDPANPETSKYGPVPFFINSQYITSQTQANDAATASLRKKLGIIENIDLSVINNPCHQANDVISIKRPRINVDNVYILNSVTKGLGIENDCNAMARSRRTA